MKHIDTLLIHAGEEPDYTGAVAPALYRSKTFSQKFGVPAEFQYSRGKNPTRQMLENKLASLEHAQYAVAFSTGNAATTAFLMTLSPGDHILCCQEIYGGTYRLLEKVMSRFGITADYVDFSNYDSIVRGIKPNTKYLFIESPTNPSLHIIDLNLVCQISREYKIPFVVDSTFSPPCSTRPIDYGAKVVIQSLSKYIAGHNDVLAGALITNYKDLYEQFFFMFRTMGAILSPDECYRVLQGVKTLSMRWKRVSESALCIAKYLENDPKIKKVNYPGLENHPNYGMACSQMAGGFGGVISFELKEKYHKYSDIKKFVDETTTNTCITYAESLASPETILAYPPLMSHGSLPLEVRNSLGITDGFFRLSVGFEDVNDILTSLKGGLNVL